jgi:hypothetical protein
VDVVEEELAKTLAQHRVQLQAGWSTHQPSY